MIGAKQQVGKEVPWRGPAAGGRPRPWAPLRRRLRPPPRQQPVSRRPRRPQRAAPRLNAETGTSSAPVAAPQSACADATLFHGRGSGAGRYSSAVPAQAVRCAISAISTCRRQLSIPGLRWACRADPTSITGTQGPGNDSERVQQSQRRGKTSSTGQTLQAHKEQQTLCK